MSRTAGIQGALLSIYRPPFGPEYMRLLVDFGYQPARVGYRWDKYAPGLDPAQ